ncbi:MAG: prefoldin subunit alpha [Candidatus Micrarchaeota archaeon]|nr:prefoldin subunit alpha [Candidatus Micrarchaeota archaeon]
MAENDDLEQMRYLYNSYLREYEVVNGELQNFFVVSSAFERNVEALSKLDIIQNANLLVGLEGGTFIEVNASNVSKVIANVGAGYMVEKSVPDARAFVEKNTGKVQDSINKLMAQKSKLEKEILDLSFKINSMQQQ